MTPHDALRALVQRYARAVDQRDLDACAALFHPDARIVGYAGEQTRGQWLEAMGAPRSSPVSMHMMGEPLVELDEDAGRATLDTYAVVYQVGAGGPDGKDVTLGVRYLDEAVLDGGRWVFRNRTSQIVWTR